jgi:hypothetical protein
LLLLLPLLLRGYSGGRIFNFFFLLKKKKGFHNQLEFSLDNKVLMLRGEILHGITRTQNGANVAQFLSGMTSGGAMIGSG